MLNSILKIVFIFCYCIVSSNTNAQSLSADFAADILSGCSPLVVNFSDSSSGGVSSRTWNFGNGNTAIGNNTQVTATYTTPGLYTVSLTVSDGIQTETETKTHYIEVFANPTPSFIVNQPTSGCQPFTVNITNTSTSTSPIVSSVWNMGSGAAPIHASIPNYTYNLPGNFGVTLMLEDSNGCSASHSIQNAVTVFPKPIVDFISPQPSSCVPPLSTQFFSNVSGGTTFTYNWNLGVGTSFLQNPTANYNSAGAHSVSLTVINNHNCTTQVVKPNYVSVGSITADFNLPDTVCLGYNTVTNTSIGGNTFEWRINGNLFSTQREPDLYFPNLGIYTVSLQISAGVNCTNSISKQVVVHKPTANFLTYPVYTCQEPLSSTYTVSNPSAFDTLFFKFGLGQQGSQSTVLTNGTGTHTYTRSIYGLFDDTLIVVDMHGCRDTLIKPANVELFRPELSLIADPFEGCVPLTVNFTDSVIPSDSIASVFWDFDNGITSNQRYPTHTFNTTGVFNVKYTLTLTGGCIIEDSIRVTVGTLQTPGFYLDSIIGCDADSFTLYNASSDTNIIDEYRWLVNRAFVSTAYNTTIRSLDTGYVRIGIAVGHLGCRDTLEMDSAFYALGPISIFRYEAVCDTPFTMRFLNDGIDYDSFTWDFGDSTPFNSIDTNPVHTYPGRGNYKVSLILHNSVTGCTDSTFRIIKVREPEACLFISDFACLESAIPFSAGCSSDAVSYKWNFGDGSNWFSTSNSLSFYRYSNKGYYNITLIVYDVNGCPDTAYHKIDVHKPNASISISDTFSCAPASIQFNDYSTSDTLISQWYWSIHGIYTTNQQNHTTTFNPNQNVLYDLFFVVKDTIGCTDTIDYKEHIHLRKPPANFFIWPPNRCWGDSISFNASNPQSGLSYTWDFGNGDTLQGNSVVYAYQNGGNFFPILTVRDSFSCDSVYTISYPLEIEKPSIGGLIASPTDTSCYPATVMFTDTTSSFVAQNRIWNFGDGSPTITNPSQTVYHTYNFPGIFDVTLIAFSPAGCVDTLTLKKFINIKGPHAKFNIDSVACVGQNLHVRFDSVSNVDSFLLDFGDGSISSNQDIHSIYHTYNQSGNATLFLVLSDATGTCVKYESFPLYISEVYAGFTIQDTIACDEIRIQTQDSSRFSNSFLWLINNQFFSTQKNIDSLYSQIGAYQLVQIAIDSLGVCSDTSSANINVFKTPEIRVSNDTLVCKGETIQLFASGGERYEWYPSSILSNPNQQVTSLLAKQDYSVLAKAISGPDCSDSAWVEIRVQHPVNLLDITSDTLIFLEQSILLEALFDNKAIVNWSPNYNIDCQNCLSPRVHPETTTRYFLTYSDTLNCFINDSSVLVSVTNENKISIPNAFTPNRDGTNDLFKPIYFGVRELKHFRVFNRWGEMMFETSNMQEGWDGYFKGQIASHNDVFVYEVKVVLFGGEEKEFIGKVLLISK